MADICADRNNAVTGGHTSFFSGNKRQPPAEIRGTEMRDLWLESWDDAALGLQRETRSRRGMIEQEHQILWALQEGAALVKTFRAMAKISVRDKQRCTEFLQFSEELEKLMGAPQRV